MIVAQTVVSGLAPCLCPISVGGGIDCEIGLFGITESSVCKANYPPPRIGRGCSIALGLDEAAGEQCQDDDGKR